MKRVKEDDYSGEFLYLVKRAAGFGVTVAIGAFIMLTRTGSAGKTSFGPAV